MPDPNGGSRTSLVSQARELRTMGAYSGGFYGAGDPLPPVMSGQPIRQWDFAPGINMRQTPRHTEPFNFKHLRAFANVELVRMAIETRKDQLERLDWQIKPRDTKAARSHEKNSDPRCLEVEKFLSKPDGATLFQPFFRALEEDLLAIDAPCLEVRRTRGGKLFGLELVDGSTINLLVDNTGRRPRGPDDVAFQQVIHGLVWDNLTNRDLIYAPRNVRTGHLYGFGPVEQIIVTINTIMRRQASQLAYFTEGNVPQGIISAPEGWTTEQIREIQEWFDQKISGNAGQQRSAIWTPFNSKYTAFKDSPIKDEFDEWLARVVAFAFSLPPTPFVRQMNKGTAGEDQERSLEEGLEPLKRWRKRLIDQIIADEFGWPDLEFDFQIEQDLDPKAQSEIEDRAVRNGSLTLDELRDGRGLDPYPDGLGAKPRVYLSAGIMPLELVDAAAEKDMAAPEVTTGTPVPAGQAPKPGTAAAAGGEKSKKKSPTTAKSLSTALGKYSDDQPRDEHGRFSSGGGGGDSSDFAIDPFEAGILDGNAAASATTGDTNGDGNHFNDGILDANGNVTQEGMEVFASNWIAGSWETYQQASASVVKGETAEQFAKEVAGSRGFRPGDDEYNAAMAVHDFAKGVMDKIDGSAPLEYPLYRGLVNAHYEVGDTFSESLTTWTSKEELAHNFAHDTFNTAGTWGSAESGAVFKVTGTGMHGINITELNPNNDFEATTVRNAAEHITSGQYRVTGANWNGPEGIREYTVARIGNAQASDLKKVVPVELEKYSDDQPRDDHGRWTSGGGGSADVMFEVSPNPDNRELAERWNKLSDAERQAVTDKISAELTPQVMNALGATGTVDPALGGFEGEINPSLVLSVNEGDPFKIAGAIGDTFGQKAMVVMSDEPMKGLKAVGMIAVVAPGADTAALRDMQGKIGDLADGFTYHNGEMQILNFSGQSDAEFAAAVDKRLEGDYLVRHAEVYSAYIEAKDYARPESDSQGNAWRETASALRATFSQRLEETLSQAERGHARKVTKFSPDQPRDERGRWAGGGGAGDTGTFDLDISRSELPRTMEAMASEPDVHQNIIGMTVNGNAIFNPDASLGLARQDMPQIPDDQRTAFLANYSHELASVDPTTLGPTQAELDSYKVALAARGALHAADPPLVSSDNYIIDGHHHWAGSVVRAQTDSSERIMIRRVDAPRATLLQDALAYDSAHGIAGEGIADKLALALQLAKAKKPNPPLGIDSNKKVLSAERRLKEAAKSVFSKTLEFVLDRVDNILSAEDDAHRDLADANTLVDLIDLSDILNLHEPLIDEIGAVIDEVVPRALASIGVDSASALVDQVSERAVLYARERAAELVSLEGDESLIASTRAMLRDTIASGLEDNIGTPAIADAIRDSMAFSDYRAGMIATTEVSMANAHAKQESWDAVRNEGASMMKQWFVSADEGVCPLCEGNADEGEISYDDAFSSGDEMEPGHPNCRCAVAVRVVDSGNSAATEEDEEE